MEIFRAEGNDRCYGNERLFNLIKNVEKYSILDSLECIETITDSKGHLEIHLKTKEVNINYLFSLFEVFWFYENDYEVTIYYNNEIIKTNKI